MNCRNFARAVRHGGWAAGTVIRHGWPRKLITYGGGIGDDLLCTIVARELRKRNSGQIWVGTKYFELFHGNSDLQPVPLSDWRFGTLAKLMGADVRSLAYTEYQAEWDRDPEPPKHFAAMMCQKAGISGQISIRPYLSLTESESACGRVSERQIVIQSSSRSAEIPVGNKEWLPERFQSVVNSLSDKFTFVQLGASNDPKLDDVIDLRGKTTLRQAAAILRKSRLFVGLAGGLMHLARAVDCAAVIVYGGRERPEISGYICNKNIKRTPPCAPCWQRNRCDYGRSCMMSIDVDTVVVAVRQILDCYCDELTVEKIQI